MEAIYWIIGIALYAAVGLYAYLAVLRYTRPIGYDIGLGVLCFLLWPLSLPMMWLAWRPEKHRDQAPLAGLSQHRVFDRWE